MDLLERIDGWGRDVPDRIAHVSGTRTLSYGELLGRSDALAGHLARALPADGSPVVVRGHKEPEMLVAFLGIVKSGHPYVPVDRSVPSSRVDSIVAGAGSALTLTVEDVAALSAQARPAPGCAVGPSDPFYIIFTSGSTGEPKGVVITLGCVTTFVSWMLEEQGLGAGREVFLNQAPFSFDLSVMDLYLSLASGGTLFSLTDEVIANPKPLHEALAASGATAWVSTPSFAQMCLAERSFSSARMPGLGRFLFCGETLAPEVASQLLDRFPEAEVWNFYGPTEATVATTSVRIDREILARHASLPVGVVMPGTRLLIIDEDGRELGPGERGEVVIVGPNVSPGYLNRPELSARAFSDRDGVRAYRTGDWGRLVDGMLFFEGRKDGQVKLHGHRIELGDVEANLRLLPGVRDAVVLPVLKRGRADSLAAFVILDERPPGDDFAVSEALRALLATRLPAYMLPRRFRFVESFPMNANGKADRHKLSDSLA